MMRGVTKLVCLAVAAVAVLHAPSAAACAACFGQSDSPLASGMNWGIFSLLGVIVPVLGGVAGFFIYLARKSNSTVVSAAPAGELLEATHKA
jgi:heme/copper-type cytochrome/quinol oxidase subunit 2